MTAFLSQKKYNKLTPEGRQTHYSFLHLHKYYDTIMFGGHRATVALSEMFVMEMKGHLDSIKKRKQKQKKRKQKQIREVE
jgi:hypothetical protein